MITDAGVQGLQWLFRVKKEKHPKTGVLIPLFNKGKRWKPSNCRGITLLCLLLLLLFLPFPYPGTSRVRQCINDFHTLLSHGLKILQQIKEPQLEENSVVLEGSDTSASSHGQVKELLRDNIPAPLKTLKIATET